MNSYSALNRGIRLTITGDHAEWYGYPQNASNSGENGKIYSGTAYIRDGEFRLKKLHLPVIQPPHYDPAGNYVMNLGSYAFYAAVVPSNASAVVNADTVTFRWEDDGLGFPTLEIDYRVQSATQWIAVNSCMSNNYNWSSPLCYTSVVGLQPATTYEWRMRTVNGTHSSQYTPVQTFTTQ